MREDEFMMMAFTHYFQDAKICSTYIFSEVVQQSCVDGFVIIFKGLTDNSTMNKTLVQIVSYSILYLNPSSYHCQSSYKKYIAVIRHYHMKLAATLLLMTYGYQTA